jgi:hypothetical protein
MRPQRPQAHPIISLGKLTENRSSSNFFCAAAEAAKRPETEQKTKTVTKNILLKPPDREYIVFIFFTPG